MSKKTPSTRQVSKPVTPPQETETTTAHAVSEVKSNGTQAAPTPLIGLALAAIIQDVGAIKKGKKNEAQGFMFRGIEDVMNALHPIFSKHAVLCIPFTEVFQCLDYVNAKGNKTFHVFITAGYRFTASDGSFIEAKAIGEGIDTSDKAAPKAQSMALKTALTTTFLIPTQDIADADNSSPTIEAGEAYRRAANPYADLTLEQLNKQIEEITKAGNQPPAELLGARAQKLCEAEDAKLLDEKPKEPAAEPAKKEKAAAKKEEAQAKKEAKKNEAPPTPPPDEQIPPWGEYVFQVCVLVKGQSAKDVALDKLREAKTAWCDKYADAIAKDPKRIRDKEHIEAAISWHEARQN